MASNICLFLFAAMALAALSASAPKRSHGLDPKYNGIRMRHPFKPKHLIKKHFGHPAPSKNLHHKTTDARARSWCDETGCHTSFDSSEEEEDWDDSDEMEDDDEDSDEVDFFSPKWRPKMPKMPTPPEEPEYDIPEGVFPEIHDGDSVSTSFSQSSNSDGSVSISISKSINGGAPITYTFTKGDGKAESYAENDGSMSSSKSKGNGNKDPKTKTCATGKGIAQAAAVNKKGKKSYSEDFGDAYA